METILEQPTASEYFTFQDILDCRKTNGAGLKIKKYDPFIFWEDMGDRWYKSFDNRAKFYINVAWIIDRLKLFQIDNLLDVGTGFGRVLPFLLDGKVINQAEGIDISPKILESGKPYLETLPNKLTDYQKAMELLNDNSVPEKIKIELTQIIEKLKVEQDNKPQAKLPDFRDRIKLKVGDVRKLDYEDNSFDAVLSSEVLQHLCPEDAYKACLEIYRVARKVIVLCERWSFPNEHSESHIWSHNYEQIFRTVCNIEFSQITTINPAIQGVVIIKN